MCRGLGPQNNRGVKDEQETSFRQVVIVGEQKIRKELQRYLDNYKCVEVKVLPRLREEWVRARCAENGCG